MITLFETTETQFTTNGLGNLPDAISCVVSEERNGEFELEMEYSITGKRYSELTLRRIIVAKPNPYAEPQPFRIYAITKPINGIVTVNAQHISYDLSGYPVSPFVGSGIQDALIKLKSSSAVNCPFIFSSDKTTGTTMRVLKPSSIRSLLGGVEGSFLDLYNGEYEFDKFKVILHNARGENRGVSIRYGKNLTDLKQEENCSNVYTGVYPFWFSEQDGLVQLSEKTLKASGTYDFTRIMPLDLSQEWQEKPTEAQLRTRATQYMKDNNIGVPKISINVSFVQLSQSEEYKNFTLLEAVHLCDTVNVEFPELNVSATSKCIKTNYDALTDKYISIELGEAVSNLASTISSQKQAIEETPNTTLMQQAINNATQLITGGLGGYVVIRSSTGSKQPDEILIMDTDNVSTATKVWRWNKGGLGYSNKGYGGPYATAITQDGSIVANFIASGTMLANRILGGVLTLGGKDNGSGKAEIKDANGKTLVTLDNKGITLDSSVHIAYSNISGTPDIAKIAKDTIPDSHITKITKDTVTTAYVNALKVKANSVDCENLTGTKISGKTIEAGGKDNASGQIFIKDANGKTLVTLDNKGITLDSSVHIAYSNISGTPDIVQITKDTINAAYINALNITAQNVNCKQTEYSGDGRTQVWEANMDAAANIYTYKGFNMSEGIKIGRIGLESWSVASNLKGLVFGLEPEGEYIGFGAKNHAYGEYIHKLAYWRNAHTYSNLDVMRDSLNVFCTLDLQGNQIVNFTTRDGLNTVVELDTCNLYFREGILTGVIEK